MKEITNKTKIQYLVNSLRLFNHNTEIINNMIAKASEEEKQCLEQFIEKNSSWIIEGTPMPGFEHRLKSADAVIFLDIPRLTCIYRIIKRSLWQLFRKQTEDGCPVKGISLITIKWLWDFPTKKNSPNVFAPIILNGKYLPFVSLFHFAMR